MGSSTNYGDLERKSGYYLSKKAAAGIVVVVVILLVVEGLLVGLVGRPNCSSENVDPVPTTTIPDKETTTMVVTSPEPSDNIWDDPRLPLHLQPINYTVSLRPIFEVNLELNIYIFKGSSSVRYTCLNSTEYVLMHAMDLNFNDAEITITDMTDGTALSIVDYMLYPKNEYIVVTTESPCVKDHVYEMSADNFWGELGDDLTGLYRSEYVNEKGENRVIALSQMQKFGARRTFPCFDEPALKATFDITLLYQKSKGYIALSNMPPIINETVPLDEEEWDSTTYDTTPVMSSYLLAMVVCDFTFKEAGTEGPDRIQTRIYARTVPVDNGEAEYAAKVTPEILDVLAEHYNVPYTLPKSDQLAAPDFGAGAMENWGLVLYRETLLLFDDVVTSVYSKYSIVQVIAHELAHQWFGNLVTNAWWDDLWLNEGFASYVQYIGVQGVHPEWEVDELFVIEDLQVALDYDDSSSSHPIHHPQGYTSSITYSKGASFLRMVNGFLGEDIFTGALTKYLEDNKYGTADYEELFQYWTDEFKGSPLEDDYPPLKNVFESWVLQMGYPLITVKKTNPTTISLTQEYFLIDENDEPVQTPGSEIYGYKWYVPFTYKTPQEIPQDVKGIIFLDPRAESGNAILMNHPYEFILGNIDAVGFYRVAYDEGMWTTILEYMNGPDYLNISAQNRAQLIDDVFAVTRSGRVSVESALNLTRYLEKELAYIPWVTYVDAMLHFDRMLASSNIYGEFSKYVLNLVVPSIYSEYGWDDSNTSDALQIERMNRGLAIQTACEYGHPDCVDTAVAMYKEWMDTSINNISSTYRTYVYCTAIRAGGVAEWDFAWEQYLDVDSAQEKTNLRRAMACSKEPWIINRYIEYAIDSSKVRKQDTSSTLGYIGSQEYSKYVAWSFAVNNWNLLIEKAGSSATNNMLSAARRRFSTEFDSDLIEALREVAGPAWNNTLNGYQQTVSQNMRWREVNEEKVANWLGVSNYVASTGKQSSSYRKFSASELKEDLEISFYKEF